VLLNHFNETYNKYIRTLATTITDSSGRAINLDYTNKPLKERIDFCIDNQLTPYFKKNKKDSKLIIVHALLDELHTRYGVDSAAVSSLNQLAQLLGMKYGPMRVNNSDKQVKCIYDDYRQKLYSILSDEEYNE